MENPMIGPLTDAEIMDQMSEEDLKELPSCEWCGEIVFRKYKRTNMHKACWNEGKAESQCDFDREY